MAWLRMLAFALILAVASATTAPAFARPACRPGTGPVAQCPHCAKRDPRAAVRTPPKPCCQLDASSHPAAAPAIDSSPQRAFEVAAPPATAVGLATMRLPPEQRLAAPMGRPWPSVQRNRVLLS